MNNIKFSIIIPVYNVDKYLNECVDSVRNQSYKNIEIILVDDGATDSCPLICDNYVQLDDRILVIHKENGGLASARNAGIQAASGEYLMFLDSDDFWNDSDAIEKIACILSFRNLDIIQFTATLLYPDGTTKPDGFHYPVKFLSNGSAEELKFMIVNNMLVGSACTKVVARKFLLDNNLLFKEGIKSEDIEWILRLSIKLPRYGFLNEGFYVYRKDRIGSITNTIGTKHLAQLMEIISNYCDDHCSMHINAYEVMMSYVAYQYLIIIGLLGLCSDTKEKHNLLIYAKKYDYLLNYKLNPKVKKVAYIYNLFGFWFTAKVIGFYMRIR